MKYSKRYQIHIAGVVQGVGFRPTIYRYAQDLGLTGNILNNSLGVIINIQGTDETVNIFIQKIKNSPPSKAQIESFKIEEQKTVKEENSFSILKSKHRIEKDVLIPPDFGICPRCINDINNSNNSKRFKYPFTNCTDCGPRFSIITDRPYDRKYTAMAPFPLCQSCKDEYNNPTNRRFHAEPNACTHCGPQLKQINKNGTIDNNVTIDNTVQLIKDGKIIAIKGIGGFNICCDPYNKETIRRLRTNKNRQDKALAIMTKDLHSANNLCFISKVEREALTSPIAPIILLKKKNKTLTHLSPDNNYLGVMLPYTPLHYLIMKSFTELIMTSANKAGEPIAINDLNIIKLIHLGIIDGALSNNRDIIHRADDSIVHIINNQIQIIRRSRGYVPMPITIVNNIIINKNKSSLSTGANLKNTFAFRKKNKVYLSQHIGDLIDFRNFSYQKKQILDLKNLLEINFNYINSDAHPNYEKYIDKNLNNKKIYHHHAHMVSVMGEHNILGKDVVGVICDGTGFGTDNTIWGFEFLTTTKDYTKFKRVGHLETFKLPGGEKAIYEIDRLAISLLTQCNLSYNVNLKQINQNRYHDIQNVLNSNLNSPQTSSL